MAILPLGLTFWWLAHPVHVLLLLTTTSDELIRAIPTPSRPSNQRSHQGSFRSIRAESCTGLPRIVGHSPNPCPESGPNPTSVAPL
ncbi:hypothetical protein PGT21_023931 [Puccinia graminis f. sp. tritici]|uniref:Secreted protein n=1 Tax=Puccinia graminis f. sp. tritici TaxID=56615 RepID=A0A5B0QWX5_PUCGR|nr:hypothetical protein PGT21_023931 [Puccinia graminis f. sp. tritici]